MKRVVSIILLFVFTYSFLGAGFVYNVWLLSIKQQVKNNLETEFEEEATLIKVPARWEQHPPKHFQWHEEHEFRYRGQMYDVIRKEHHGNQIWYYCYWDKAETKLLNNLSHYVNNYLQQKPDQQKTKTLISSFLDKTFISGGDGGHLLIPRQIKTFPIRDETAQSTFIEVEHPPPRVKRFA